MGDASEQADLERFVRSEEGKEYLDKHSQFLLNKKITDVVYELAGSNILFTLVFDDNSSYTHNFVDHYQIQSEFEEVLEREYFKDYPERKL